MTDYKQFAEDLAQELSCVRGELEEATAGTFGARDKARLDWLQGRIVDTIYLDDGKIVDVRGLDLRKAIDAAAVRWPGKSEDEEV